MLVGVGDGTDTEEGVGTASSVPDLFTKPVGAVLGPFLDLVVITVAVIRLFGRFGPKGWHCEQLG